MYTTYFFDHCVDFMKVLIGLHCWIKKLFNLQFNTVEPFTIIMPGYTGVYLKRSGDKNDGCATLWKENRFRLLQYTPVLYRRGGLLDRDNVAVIVELQPLRTSESSSSRCVCLHVSLLLHVGLSE